MENETWKFVNLPTGRKPVGWKWTKHTCDGKVERYEARLATKGYTQKPGEDYDETYSPVARHSSICVLLAFLFEMAYSSPDRCGNSIPEWNIK